MDEDKKFIIVVDDRLWKSIGRDVFTFGSLLAVVCLGILLNSAVLQWICGIIWAVAVLSKVFSETKKNKFTISEARAELDRLESEA